MGVGDFIRATLRISLAIVIAVVALAAIAWGGWALYNRNAKLEAQQYEVAKHWHADVKRFLQLDLVVTTKLVDSRLRAVLKLDGYPAYLSDPRLQAKNRDAVIIVGFQDADGFKIYNKPVKIAEFTTIVDEKGNKIGLEHQFDDYLSIDSYKAFSKIDVTWTLDTVSPPKVAVESPKPRPATRDGVADPCAPGLSKAERLRRLATYGTVRQTGEEEYSVGFRTLRFYSALLGGGLVSCR
jgi:hypothetical protein